MTERKYTYYPIADLRFQGEERPPAGLNQDERRARQDGYNTAAEEDDDV